LIDYGDCRVRFFLGAPSSGRKAERVSRFPFTVRAGKVVIESLEDYYCSRLLILKPGRYELTVTQDQKGEEAMGADLFFDPQEGQYHATTSAGVKGVAKA
jgi:hypothetical protein